MNQDKKPRLSLTQIINMSVGFMGIQFGFALQNANTSRIFSTLGANPDEIPILWVAAPLTGLLVQPIIGYLSDRTWHPTWGRRRPFFFAGAILATLALILMPQSKVLWMAGAILWMMDASINVSMEPFRAFVGDMLPNEQRTTGFSVQTFFIGVGAMIASGLPSVLDFFGVQNAAPEGIVPDTVKWSFYIGAFAYFACILWTVLNTKEYPPEDMVEFEREKSEMNFMNGVKETVNGLFKMPTVMKQLAWVQFFSWFALFCMWIFSTNAITKNVFGTSDTTSTIYNEGANFVGICFLVYNGVSMIFALFLPAIAAKVGRKMTHLICLVAGGLGLISIMFVSSKYALIPCFVGIGFAWASILAMPYAMLSGSLPVNKMGYFMGVFNFFIVIPQIIASLGLSKFMSFAHLEPIQIVMMGGIFMIISGLLTLRVQDNE
ncbi:MAG: MFS transporter [Arcicella sp.]|jgi:maltose/moltooligosaccharide transporter|nr:MFS transporter [Arcicella sp.]